MAKVKRMGNGRGRPKSAQDGPDRGTVECKSRREWFVQSGAQELAVFPLGVMYANGVVDATTYEAGCRYAWLYEALYGRTSAAAQNYGDRPAEGLGISPEAMVQLRSEMKTINVALDALPRAFKDELDNAVVFGRFPCWLLPVAPRPKHMHEHKRLMDALGAVQLALGYTAPQKGRTRLWKSPIAA